MHGGDAISDLYGKLSYSWLHPSRYFRELRSILIRTTRILTLDGHYPATNPPNAFIAVPLSKVCIQAPVKLTDYSVFGPYTRQWKISPATIPLPMVQAVPLPILLFNSCRPEFIPSNSPFFKASHGGSMRLNDAFQAGTTIEVGINSLPAGETCLTGFDNFMAWANGATSYV